MAKEERSVGTKAVQSRASRTGRVRRAGRARRAHGINMEAAALRAEPWHGRQGKQDR